MLVHEYCSSWLDAIDGMNWIGQVPFFTANLCFYFSFFHYDPRKRRVLLIFIYASMLIQLAITCRLSSQAYSLRLPWLASSVAVCNAILTTISRMSRHSTG